MGTTDKRKHRRAELALLVQYRFNSVEDFLAEYATNLSPGGMFIQTQAPLKVGSTVHLLFSLKDGSRLIDGLARVVRRSDTGMGVEFVDLDDESAGVIRRLCSAGA